MTIEKKVNIVSWFVAILAVNNVIVFTPNLGGPYYLMIGFALFFILLQSRIRQVDLLMLLMYFCCLISILGNNIPSFFKPWGRLISFILMTMLLSPLLKSVFLDRFKVKLFSAIQQLMEYVILASTVAYFLGVAYNMGYFAGITTHSLLVAPIAANVCIRGVYKLTKEDFSEKKKWMYYYIVLIFCCLICLLLAASRTALIAVIVSVLFYLYMINRGTFSKFIKYVFIALIALLLSFPLWYSYLDVVIKKTEGSIAAGGLTSSRDVHWEHRVEEFKSSPIIGIGFSSISVDTEVGSTFDIESGRVETGSSWLTSMSMLGILGFSTLLSLFAVAFRKLFKISKIINQDAVYPMALLLFWVFHMMAEGYIFASGSFLFFNVWLLFGYADALGRECNR